VKIVRTDRELETPHIDGTLRAAGHELVLLPDGTAEDDLVDAVGGADLILMCYTPITARVIRAAESLKGIVKYGVGVDAIDIPAAHGRGVQVVNIPEYAEETVAEGAFALMIALAKKLAPLNAKMQAEGWAWPQPPWLGGDIAGKTVGLVGFGKIARSMARMAGAGFRARVLAYDPNVSGEAMTEAGVEKRDHLLDLLAESDFVSLHCVLTNQSRGLIGRRELSAMKPSAFLINTARGALVHEAALLDALDNGTIAGAGLDVFSAEPLSRHRHPMSPLFGRDNVILTPHLTFYTAEAMHRLEAETLERCFEILEGREVQIKSLDPRLSTAKMSDQDNRGTSAAPKE